MQFDLVYKPRTSIKGQALADFIVKFTTPISITIEPQGAARWKLYVDGASNENGAGAGIILISPNGLKISSAIRFSFCGSNNEAEYEALLAGVKLARELHIDDITIFSDLKLIFGQVTGEFEAK